MSNGGITAGPDGNLWFTEEGFIGRLCPICSPPPPTPAPPSLSTIPAVPPWGLLVMMGALVAAGSGLAVRRARV